MAEEVNGFSHRPFEDLSTFIKEKGLALKSDPGALSLPVPPAEPSGDEFVSPEKFEEGIKKILEWKKTSEERLTKHGEWIGRTLNVLSKLNRRDEYIRDQWDHGMSAVARREEEILSYFKGEGVPPKARVDFTLAYMGALIRTLVEESTLPFSLGLNHLADQGLRLDFFTEAKEGTPESQYVILPVTGPDGRWHATRLTTNFPGSKGMIALLRKKVEEKNTQDARAIEEAAEKLNQGTDGTFLEVFSKGGEAVLLVPKEEREGRFYAGGYLRVEVQRGQIRAVGAAGPLSFRNLTEKIKEANIFLSVASVKKDRLELKDRVSSHERYNLIYAFHRILHRSWKQLVEPQAPPPQKE